MNDHGTIRIPFSGSLVSAVHIDRSIVNRCPACGTPFCTGELAPGTRIEVKCRRCKKLFHVISAQGEAAKSPVPA